MAEQSRGPRRRPPFALALVGLVVLLTAMTGFAIGGLAWRENRATSRALLETAMAQTARLTAGQAGRFLHAAEATVRLGPELVARGQLDPQDTAALEGFTVAVLIAQPELSWVSYGDRDDRFVGAWRDADGKVYLNRSYPHRGRIRLEEDEVLADGGRRPVRRSDDHGYRPRERPHFAAADRARGVVWTEPYEFYAGGGLGISCAAPLVLDGQLRGVFTVDFSLEQLAGFLETLDVSPRGRVFLATRHGTLLLGRSPERGDRIPVDAALVQSISRRIDPDRESEFELEDGGEAYLGRAVPLVAGNLSWLVQVVVPERDYMERIDAQARRTIALGLGALGLALGAGLVTARWIARPLRELAEQARRIRQGNLEVTVVPRSRDEIGVLTRAMADMARALKDRDFIREALGRYVNPELAEQCLRDPSALHLGGELRQVTILMSDLRRFSELSERLGPEPLIGLLNRYLARMTPVILEHGGTISDFIGDGILVVFGAPIARPDDPVRAARCAWVMQRELRQLNEESRALGLPELAMGIGVNAGAVVAGNIGSSDRVKYGVVGAPVNLASRIQALAAGGEILVSEGARQGMGPAPLFGPARLVQVKGAAEPIVVRDLIGFDEEATVDEQPLDGRVAKTAAPGLPAASAPTTRPAATARDAKQAAGSPAGSIAPHERPQPLPR